MFFSLLFCVIAGISGAIRVERASVQNPPVWDAVDVLKGSSNRELTVDQIQELFLSVRPGQDFPILSEIPQSNVDCALFHQPGFYADVDAGRCQVFHRCDINGNLTSYLCPNMTLFNQITLVCDWWFNIDCASTAQFFDYSNSRLYLGADVPLLDNQDVVKASGAGRSSSARQKGSSKKKHQKKRGERF